LSEISKIYLKFKILTHILIQKNIQQQGGGLVAK
jgi:hypothetical protein